MESVHIMTGAEPFLLKGGPRGILLIHGFTGTPAELRLLGEYLHRKNFTVLAVRLPGHGTEVRDMEPTTWRHWYGATIDGLKILSGICSEINVLGLSMGGLLALKLASEYPVSSVTALSTPIFLAERRIPLLPLYRKFRRYIPQKRRDYDIDPLYYVGYDYTPLASLASLLELIDIAKADLPKVRCPALLVQSRREHTVRPESATFILENLGTKQKELFWLKNSGHVVTIDGERALVFSKVAEFLNSTISRSEHFNV